MGRRLRLGPLDARHRGRLADVLRATAVFNDAEIAVAMELFDEGMRGTEYQLVGAFSVEAAGKDGGDALVGYACYGPTPATDRTWDLYWIAVDPAVQGAGGGTLLLTEVERRLSERDARMLVVETSSRSDYAATRRFYQTRGYEEEARLESFYAPADDRIIFTKRFHEPRTGPELHRHE